MVRRRGGARYNYERISRRARRLPFMALAKAFLEVKMRDNMVYKYIRMREYQLLARFLGIREFIEWALLELLDLPKWAEERLAIEEYKAQLVAIAIRNYLRYLRDTRPIRTANHPLWPILLVSYSELRDLAAMAQLAYADKNPFIMPLMGGLTKHMWCSSSRNFIRWDGYRGTAKWYMAFNNYKDSAMSPAPATPDHESLTLPLVNVWLFKYDEDWTTILDIMAKEIYDMTESVPVTRDGRNKPKHTMPLVVFVYTDWPQRLRFIVIGLPEYADTSYHCSLYYMPVAIRDIRTPFKTRTYEAKWRRRYRRRTMYVM